ncbi:MAG: DNA polymerase IV [Anaerofustis sp.]
MNEKIIFHADVNSAFLSWEATYRKDRGIDSVDLRTVPSIVGGDIQKRRGIVLAKSVPAKKYGIQTGEPVVSAIRKCPFLIVVPPTYGLYAKCSANFMALLKQYSPIVEQYSVDECFLDCTQAIKSASDPISLANEIRERAKKELGFTVNIGISSNKLLAKMASEFEKPDKTHTLFPHEIEEKMWPLDIAELFMVGRKTAQQLRSLGILTIRDLAQADLEFLIRHFKRSRGLMLYQYARGLDLSSVRNIPLQAKSVGNSTTLPHDVCTRKDALLVILSLCEMVGKRLRAKSLHGNLISVSFKNFAFRYYSAQQKIYTMTNQTQQIYEACIPLFDTLWKGDAIRHLGVCVSNLSDSGISQPSFFDLQETIIRSRVDSTIDEIRTKFGNGSIMRASFAQSKHPPICGGPQNRDNFPMMKSGL